MDRDSFISLMNEKNSIKNILFTRAIPNYKIPIPVDGYQVFSCIDCGDSFLIESSLSVHINRKSIMIDYYCRHCCKTNKFFNRCQFLAHVRSHVTNTATIYLSDLKVAPIPLSITLNDARKPNNCKYTCFDCKKDITVTEIFEKDRALHYMEAIDRVNCPVCLLRLPSSCALITHLRIHLKTPPFICYDCGKNLRVQDCIYPYNHDCGGFQEMKEKSKMKCFNESCPAISPNDFIEHLKSCHLNKILKCPNCNIADYNENTILKHMSVCCNKTEYITYFECQRCPGILFSLSQIEEHFDDHFLMIKKRHDSWLFPCWNCGLVLHNVYDFLKHHVSEHYSLATQKILIDVINNVRFQLCGCQKTLWYWQGCHEGSTECFSCILNETVQPGIVHDTSNPIKHLSIKCHLCRTDINENWEDIKMHFSKFHKTVKCLDLKLILHKFNVQPSMKIGRQLKQKRKSTNITLAKEINNTGTIEKITEQRHSCPKCNYDADDRNLLESHLKTHRDPNLAYQCMECGNCLAVKPSFATHLLMKHEIFDVEDYIKKKDCFNKAALEKTVNVFPEENIPLEENQCNVCRQKFPDSNTLDMHYRVHGMAFLMKHTQKSKTFIEIN